MTEPQNIIDKIWHAHLVSGENNGCNVFFIDLQLLHKLTGPQAFTNLDKKGLGVAYPERNFAALDHRVSPHESPPIDADAPTQQAVQSLQQHCENFNIPLLDFGTQDTVDEMSLKHGLTQPGKTIVCSSDHILGHGALGALAFKVDTKQINYVMATQTLLLEKPKTMKVEFVGTPSKHFTAKDAIPRLIDQIGIQGAQQYAIEFCGQYIKNLSIKERMIICHMSLETGAFSGIISPDYKTFDYLKGRSYCTPDPHPETPAEKAWTRKTNQWAKWGSDKDADYDTCITVDLAAQTVTNNSRNRHNYQTTPLDKKHLLEPSSELDYLLNFKTSTREFSRRQSLLGL